MQAGKRSRLGLYRKRELIYALEVVLLLPALQVLRVLGSQASLRKRANERTLLRVLSLLKRVAMRAVGTTQSARVTHLSGRARLVAAARPSARPQVGSRDIRLQEIRVAASPSSTDPQKDQPVQQEQVVFEHGWVVGVGPWHSFN